MRFQLQSRMLPPVLRNYRGMEMTLSSFSQDSIQVDMIFSHWRIPKKNEMKVYPFRLQHGENRMMLMDCYDEVKRVGETV